MVPTYIIWIWGLKITLYLSREIPSNLHGGNTDLEMEDDESDVMADGEDSFVEDTPMNKEDGTHGSGQ